MSMIQVKDLTFSYPSSYDLVFERVSFQIDTDWKLGFVGRNGRGKTTFLSLLLGKYEYQGHIQASVAFDYFPYPVEEQDRMTMEVLSAVCPQAEEWELWKELSGGPGRGALAAVFHPLPRRTNQGPACGAFFERRPFFADRRTDQPFGCESQRDRLGLSETEKRIYFSLSRPPFFGWLC